MTHSHNTSFGCALSAVVPCRSPAGTLRFDLEQQAIFAMTPHASLCLELASRARSLVIAAAVLIGLSLLAPAARAGDGAGRDDLVSGGGDPSACGSTTGRSVPELVAEGKRYYRSKNWLCSRVFFQHAYTKQESYDVVGNLGIATYEVAKSRNDAALFAEAATFISAAVRGFPASQDETMQSKLAALQERLGDCTQRVVTLVLENTLTPRSACLVIAGRDAGCGPFTHDLFAAPGNLVIQAKAPGYPSAEQTLAGAAANTRHTVRFDLTAGAGPARSGSPSPGSGGGGPDTVRGGFPLWPTFVAAGLAVAAFGVGGGLWGAGEAESNDAVKLRNLTANDLGNDNFCAPPVAANAKNACDDIEVGLARGEEFKQAAVGLFIGGGVLTLGVGALVATHLLTGNDGADSASAGFRVAPLFDPRGGAVMMIEGRW